MSAARNNVVIGHPRANGLDVREDALPHSRPAEQNTLGGMLLDPSVYAQVAEILQTKDFYFADHRLIFDAIAATAGEGKPCDVITVSEQLQRFGELDNAGGLNYLGTLSRDTAEPAHVLTYARIVRERSLLRGVNALGHNLVRAASQGKAAEEILEAAEPDIRELARSAKGTARRTPLRWSELQDHDPPQREWAEDHWLGMGHVTLLSGGAGAGKTSLAQAWGSCLAIRRSYLDWVSAVRTVLIWGTEDDEPELWRRQIAIARWLNVPLSAFSERLHIVSYDGEDVELAGLVDQRRLVGTAMLTELRQQISDHRADVVMLDNIARLYGGNENDRHQVSQFVAMLRSAGTSTNAAVLLLGHPGKAQGSEYSGSTAWEGAVRSRLYLGRALPDAELSDEEPAEDDSVRYLCRRKANYSTRDWRRVHYQDGVIVPERPPEPGPATSGVSDSYAADVVASAVRKLAQMQQWGSASSASPTYLPKLAKDYELLDRLTQKQFAAAMRRMQSDGQLIKTVVGTYANRTKKEGLTLKDGAT